MRLFSKKRAKENRQYLKLRAVFLLENPVCKVKGNGCKGRATEVHHAAGRIGNLLLNTDYFIQICDNCHRWVELNPKEAKLKGYSVSRLAIK